MNEIIAGSLIAEATKLLGSGLPLAAVNLLEELIQAQPENENALHLMAKAHFLLNEPAMAAIYLSRSLVGRTEKSQTNSMDDFGIDDQEYADATSLPEDEYVLGSEYQCGSPEANNESNPVKKISDTETAEPALGKSWLEFDALPETDTEDDWEHVVLEGDFTDFLEEGIDYDEVAYTGKISQDDRARQIVSEMALEYDMSDELFDIIVRIVAFHSCHGQTKLAMRRLLEGGVSADEIETVFELRRCWAGNEGFSRAYFGWPEPIAAYLNLSWPLGLDLVRHLGCDDVEIAEMFIEDCFDDWQFSTRLIEGFSSFRVYLAHLVEHAIWSEPHASPPYIDYRFFECSESQVEDLPGSSVYKWLEEHSQLPGKASPNYPHIVVEPVETPKEEMP